MTVGATLLAIGVYEIVRHQDFQAFWSTPLGKVSSVLSSGGLLYFFYNVYNGGSIIDALTGQVEESPLDTIKTQVQSSYSDMFWSYLDNQSEALVAAGLTGIFGVVALLINYFIG